LAKKGLVTVADPARFKAVKPQCHSKIRLLQKGNLG